jgi:Xaa-Pro dipeptidase
MLHFTHDEFAARRRSVMQAMAAKRLDALLMFRQESMYWLTGYDTFGYVFFQCLVMTADGTLILLTRRPDREQARLTSVIGDVRIWVDGDGAQPALMLRDIIDGAGLRGRRLGVEFEAYGLTGRNCMRLLAAMEGVADLSDASELITRLRLVKSPAELDYVRRAAALADDALGVARHMARPGVSEADILAEMQAAVLRGDGDLSGNPFIIGSGDHALLVRYASGRRVLGARDQLMLEFAGSYRHYHACLMRTLCIGEPSAQHRAFHDAACAALRACIDTMQPGRTVGEVFAAHARVFDEAGFGAQRLNACGYSLGTTFQPNWMDWPMIYAGNPVVIEPGMVFFLHMILADPATNTAMAPGLTVVTTDGPAQVLSRHALDPIAA